MSITGDTSIGSELTATVSDSNGFDVNSVSYQWYRDGVVINGATSDKYTLVAADGGAAISVQASFTDNDGFNESPTSAAINPVNSAPTIVIDSVSSFTEDSGHNVGDTVATFTTSDADGDAVTVTLSDTTHYALDAANGKVTLTQAGLDKVNAGEELPAFTLTPSDATESGEAKSADPSVAAVNDKPELTIDTVNSFTEDSGHAVGDTVATFSTSDADGNEVSVALSDTTHYALDAVSGKVTLTQAGLDKVNAGEELPAFSLTPSDATESGEAKSADPSVAQVNDKPELTIDSVSSFTEDSGHNVGDTVATFSTSDADGDEVSVTLSDTTHYALDVVNGKVTLTQAGLDKVNAGEELPAFSLTPSDASESGDAKSADPSVAQVNDKPELTIDTVNSFTEDSGHNVGDTVATFSTSDADGDQVTVTLSDTTHYALDVANGKVTLTQAGLDKVNAGEELPAFSLTPSDASESGDAKSAVPSVAQVNDKPELTIDTVNSFTEDSGHNVGDTVATFTTSDADGDGDEVSVTLSDTTHYALDAANGKVTLTQAGLDKVNAGEELPAFSLTPSDAIESGDAKSADPSVAQVNDKPELTIDSVNSFTEDSGHNVGDTVATFTTSDADGDAVTVTLSDTTHYALDVANGKVTLTQAGLDKVNAGEELPAFSLTPSDASESGDAKSADPIVYLNNDAPIAINDGAEQSIELDEDSQIAIDILANDSDEETELNPASIIITVAPQFGSVSIDTDTGIVTYTPNKDYFGDDSFSYTVQDTQEQVSNQAEVFISVAAIEDAPIAVNDVIELNEDTEVNFAILANDTDVDSDFDLESVAFVNIPEDLMVVLNEDGSITVSALTNINGTFSFDYIVYDLQGNPSNSAQVSVIINADPDAPIANDDSFQIEEDVALEVALSELLANDSDLDFMGLDAASFTITQQPQHGTVAVIDEQLTYQAETNNNADVSFSYQIQSNNGLWSNIATVTIAISPVNDAPIAIDDTQLLEEDGTIDINIVANDYDIDSQLDLSSLEILQQPLYGTVSILNDGLIRYRANENYFGDDELSYRVADEQGLWSNAAMVKLSISSVNDAPIAVDDNFTIAEDESVLLTLLVNDSDQDGSLDHLAIEFEGEQSLGGLSEVNGLWTYSTSNNAHGTEVFNYRVKDNQGEWSNWASISIEITPVNDAPTANDLRFEVNEGESLAEAINEFVDDIDGDNLTFTLVNLPTVGQASLSESGELIYSHDGSEQHLVCFDYKVNDGQLDSNSSQICIDVIAVNDPPIALDDNYQINEDTSLSLTVADNDSDPEQQLLTIASVNAASLGQVSIVDGQILYVANTNAFGTDSFVYQIVDEEGLSATATVTVEILAVNDLPVALDDRYQTNEDIQLVINPIENDSDVDGDGLLLTWLDNPLNGEISRSGGGLWLYQPAANYVGQESLAYQIVDAEGALANATVEIIINPVNDAPVAVDDYSATDIRTVVSTNVLANDFDVDNDELIIESASASIGSITINADGSLSYQPSVDSLGQVSVNYAIVDQNGGAANATWYIDVAASNLPPVAVDDETVVDAGAILVTVDVLANDSDPDGDSLTLVNASSTSGEVTVENQQISYRFDSEFNGFAEVEYLIEDGFGGSDKASLFIYSEDALKPIVSAPEPTWVDATGLFTKVDLGTATAVDRYGNPLPVSLVDGVPFYQPGANTAYWEACDEEGRCGRAPQKVYVRPLVSIAKDNLILEGQSAKVEVVLNGNHFDYPVIVGYQVSGSATAEDHDLVEGEISITSGSTGWIEFNTTADDVDDSGETLIITLKDSQNLGVFKEHTSTILEGNLPPEVELVGQQDGNNRLLASQLDGEFTINALVIDPNSEDTHQLNWTIPESINYVESGNTISFEPSELAVGLYSFSVEVSDNQGASDIDTILVAVTDADEANLANLDADGDLLSDSTEGFKDSDFDGIADYLDQMTDECNVLPASVDNWDGFILEASPSVCLRTGVYSTQGSTGGSQITDIEINKPNDDLNPDTQAVNIGGLFDFIAYKLAEPGQDIFVVMPQRNAIPENAVYRKHSPQHGWYSIDEPGIVFSTQGEPGFCPPPGTAEWTEGLTVGHWCVKLKLQDGTKYDDDGLVNGVIYDPGGVGVLLTDNTFPIAQNDEYRVKVGQTIILDVLQNDSDSDGDNLMISSMSNTNASKQIINDSQIEYTATNQSENFIYSLSDGKGGSSSARVQISVYYNNPPNARDDKASTQMDKQVEIVVLNNDNDIDSDELQIVSTTTEDGIVQVQSGKIIFTPNTNFVGTAHISYKITDGFGEFAQANVEVTVTAEQSIETSGGNISLLMLGTLLLAFMRKLRLSLGLVSLSLLLTIKVNAQQQSLSPWFIQGEANWVYSHVDHNELNNDFVNVGIQANSISLKKSRLGYGLGLGYYLSDAWFMQAGWLDLGEVEFRFSGQFSNTQQFYDRAEHIYPESGHGPYIQIGRTFRFNQQWTLDARLGLLSWSGNYQTIPESGPGSGQDKPSENSALYHLNLNYNLNSNWKVGAQLARVEFSNYPLTQIGLTSSYRFGSNKPQRVAKVKPVMLQAQPVVVEPKTEVALVMPIDSYILFEHDKYKLTEKHRSKLIQLVNWLKENGFKQIKLQAYASKVGTKEYNQALSERRLASVMSYLEQRQIKAIINGIAFGEVELEDDFGGALYQRRVSISLLNNGDLELEKTASN
ncbi:Ig-like domain-containing protein [Paraferrimonas sp. SM1919]|uniref:Ig-like domain-containing protein n=1 Tax=Paraferrimonas sp. SM1919 TaxID=2662263 RepID=UPI001969CD78|nr:Ig-like domain-containing protein [Paraferrimonas sp. SM1919]